ncbi:MAG: anthranilate synthase component I family protein [Chitinophagaceae bacterium]|nr:anthranilate synthase component I family protein [Chitinophagaceae bacterium]
MLNWGNRFNICAFLDNHQYQLPGHRHECLAGFGMVQQVRCEIVYENINHGRGNALQQLQHFIDVTNDWCFGHLSYELKNEIENLSATHKEQIGFPLLYFFVPQYVIQLNETELKIGSLHNDHLEIYEQIVQTKPDKAPANSSVTIQERISREQYISAIQKIQQHILRGDCYELNYCMEFFAEDALIDPLYVYQQLTSISPNPFSAFYKVDNSYLLCASPERFLRKKGRELLSQPIKGTAKRSVHNTVDDEDLKQQLYKSEKDRSENVMVVDLVRNDLSRVCKEGTVKVEELFGIYSFPQVHQMISTVSGELKEDVSFAEIIQSTFPMGSMTGAPKRKVLQLIDAYELTARGIFSGAVGYISPEKDFDLNVVIRSILYNNDSRHLSYLVGSGITWYSNAEQEYEECLLKAGAIRRVLG